MLRRRIQRRPVPDTAGQLPAELHPVLRRIYAARRLVGPEDLECDLRAMHPPHLLGNVEAAAELLAEHVTAGRHILLVGDFDADGATSCAVAVRALRAMGARHVDFLVPNRFDYGYGLSPEIVAVAREARPDLIVTVDNGISSLAGVAAAREAGIRVLVTDHHLPGAMLPDANVIVNPNLPGDGFPSKNLAGVGVIFYVMVALRSALREADWFAQSGIPEPPLVDLLDLVALGTVADVVPLDRNNRILVEQGLRRIRAGRMCPGIRGLLEVAGRDHRRAVASDLGFAAGPRLNAAGRLEDMELGIRCLICDDTDAAMAMARELDALNRQRRQIEGQMKAEALAGLEQAIPDWGEEAPSGLCLLDEGWHQGVIGILAARIKERFHRPVVAFAPAGDGEIKGSARSIPGLHMRDLLEQVSSRHPGLIAKFGGHAMAAGLSLRRDGFEAFRLAFEEAVAGQVGAGMLEGVIVTDGELAPEDFHMDLAEQLRHGGPWGQGFPEPSFDGVFSPVGRRVVGENHLRLRLVHPGGDGVLEAIAFNALDRGWDGVDGAMRLAYRLDVNEYRGRRSLQLMVEYLEAAE